MNDAPGLPSRRAALKLLDAVLRRGETLEQAGRHACARLSQADAALARAISAEALRWMVDLDLLIDSAMKKPVAHDAKVRMVLRIMLVQALQLHIAPHAVVATGLPLLSGGPRRLAHGVFSFVTRNSAFLPEAPTLPDPVASRWQKAWPDRIAFIAAGLAEPPPLDLTLRDAKETKAWAEQLQATVLASGRLRLPRGCAVADLPGYGEGHWWVQDLAASIPATLLGPGDGRRALDLCAAPGGKTMQLAANGWQVTAIDNSSRRIERLIANLDRTKLVANIIKADLREWAPSDGLFDAVLLDAPCTATGTCRRNPEVLHRELRGNLAGYAQHQREFLSRAASWLSPGGKLVYSVCSLEPEEGEKQMEATGLSLDPICQDELPAGISAARQGWVRTDPGMLAGQGGLDGFFIARLVRS